jgi:hypothetical protein
VQQGIRQLTVGLIGWALTALLAPVAKPLASHVEPLASHVEPLASHIEPLASHIEPLASHARRPLAAPAIAHIEPNNGATRGGTVVRIAGERFPHRATVSFGSIRAHVLRASSSSIVAIGPAGVGAVNIRVSGSTGISPPSPRDMFAYDQPPSGRWLGLNDNSASYLGPVGQFVTDSIAYDREEYVAGRLPSRRDSLHRAIAHHMIPDVVIEYAGYTGAGFGSIDPSFPTGEAIARYASGFVRTASAIRRAYPGRRVLFEPINEPYGHATAAQYAAVIARLLPAARSAGIPLNAIYVAAFGKGWVPAMYAAAPALRTLVEGWYFHPYGPPSGAVSRYTAGIQSLPRVQAEMTSGQSNIIVSEIGWCAGNVNHGAACGQPRTSSARQAARLLLESLDNALPMRRAGWLKALLVYSRSDGGWAMELPNAVLTESGRALVRFARAHPAR